MRLVIWGKTSYKASYKILPNFSHLGWNILYLPSASHYEGQAFLWSLLHLMVPLWEFFYIWTLTNPLIQLHFVHDQQGSIQSSAAPKYFEHRTSKDHFNPGVKLVFTSNCKKQVLAQRILMETCVCLFLLNPNPWNPGQLPLRTGSKSVRGQDH